MTQSLFTSPWTTRQEFFDRLGAGLGGDYKTYTAAKRSRGVAGDFTIGDLTPYQYDAQEFAGDNGMMEVQRTGYKSALLDQLFGQGGWEIVSGGQSDGYNTPAMMLRTRTMADPTSSTGHPGSWNGTIDPATGRLSGLQWINDDLSSGVIGNTFDKIGDALTNYGWAIPLAFAGAGAAGLLGGSAGAGGAVGAGAIEGAVGLPELGLATQTGLGGSMTLPTAGLGGLMEGVAPALPSGTGLGLTGGSGITGGTLTSSPLLTGGGLAPGLEALASAGGSSLGWLGDLAKTALGKDGWLPSVLNAFSQNQQGNIQRDWAERLYQDRAQFLQRLARTYTNPEEFLSGPEYQALSRTTLDQLQRQDAAKGRLATDVQRQKLMQDYAFEYLNKYRSGLAGAAGLTQTTGIPELDKSGAANIWGTLNAPLSQIARGVTNDSFDIGGVVDRIFNLGSWFE